MVTRSVNDSDIPITTIKNSWANGAKLVVHHQVVWDQRSRALADVGIGQLAIAFGHLVLFHSGAVDGSVTRTSNC